MRLSDISIHAFINQYQIKNESGIPLDFRDHLFLFDIYADQSPKLVCYKAAQIGFTTMAILKALWLAKMKRMDIIYTMPTSDDAKQLVGGKVNRMINQNPILQQYVKDKDSIEQKAVADSLIHFKGTWVERASISTSSDLNIHDEEDRSKQEVVQQYASRLQHSKFKYEWHFSNPSVEGNGVSRYWAKSDQKHWFITCRTCTKEQFLEWPNSICKEKRVFICKHCSHELSREERRVGRWVKKYKNKEFSGYWISLLMAPWITADEILNYYETKSAEYFSNFVLGLPYVGEGNQVTPDIIYRNCTPEINSQDRVVIGCDSGLKKHYVLGNKNGIFYAGITPTWDTIRQLLKKYERSVAVIDALPDLTEPRRLREEFPGRVFLCHYARDRKTMQIVRWGKGEELGNVTVDRNRMMQMVIDDFANKAVPLQGTQDDWADYESHWSTLYKIVEVDTLGVPQFKWETSNGMDHFCHACFPARTLITTEKGCVPIEDIKVGDYVLTRNGFEKVSYSGLIKKSSLLTITFEDGRTISATPEHKFWTENRGWVELQNITKNDILVSIWNNDLTEKYINYTKANGIYLQVDTSGCIGMCGSFIMDKFRKVSTFIIKIIIRLITIYPIWKRLIHSNTWEDTLYENSLKILSAKCAELGINQKTRAIIATAPLSAGQSYTQSDTIKWKGNVESVKNDLPPISILGQSTVLKTVRIKTIVTGTKKIPVYGITVGSSHEYFAHDILVANSLYWRVGMDRFKNDGGKLFSDETITFPSTGEIRLNDTMDFRPRFIFEEKEDD